MASMQATETAPMRFYWQPGCSSCVRVKELLTDLGVDFASVNILEDEAGFEELTRRGIRSVPVLIRGDEVLFTQSLEDVATFVGRSYSAERLPPEELFRRWQRFLSIAVGLVRQLPPDRLEQRAIPERPRTLGNLSYHIFQIPEGVMAMVEGRTRDSRDYHNVAYDHLRSVDDIVSYAEGVIDAHKAWWPETDRTGRRQVETYYGRQSLHQILERGTWHSAQHIRQLNHVLDEMGVAVSEPVPPALYEGLPMPKVIWA